MRFKAFTLIELLIVVAIIAILAAIAVPNFLEAQTRAKVSKVKADLRTLATALESYAVDANNYPPIYPSPVSDSVVRMYNHFSWEVYNGHHSQGCIQFLTSPVGYLSMLPDIDPFSRMQSAGETDRQSSYWYTNFRGAYKDRLVPLGAGDTSWSLYFHDDLVPTVPVHFIGPDGPVLASSWMVISPGPSRLTVATNYQVNWFRFLSASYPELTDPTEPNVLKPYDPTNGTTSLGVLIRTSGGMP